MANKGALESKTIWGALLVLFAPLLNRFFGVDLDEATQADISGVLTELLQVIGAIIAIYGRIVAKAQIGPEKIKPMVVAPIAALMLTGCAAAVYPLAHQYCAATTAEERQAIRDRLGYDDVVIECGE